MVYIDRYIDFNPPTIAPNTLLQNAVISITSRGEEDKANCVLVIADNKLVGILTQTDLVKSIALGTDFAITTVEEVMTQPVLTRSRSQCSDFDSVRFFFQQHSVSYLPLVNGDRELVGVISDRALIHSSLPESEAKPTVARQVSLQKKNRVRAIFLSLLLVWFVLRV